MGLKSEIDSDAEQCCRPVDWQGLARRRFRNRRTKENNKMLNSLLESIEVFQGSSKVRSKKLEQSSITNRPYDCSIRSRPSAFLASCLPLSDSWQVLFFRRFKLLFSFKLKDIVYFRKLSSGRGKSKLDGFNQTSSLCRSKQSYYQNSRTVD